MKQSSPSLAQNQTKIKKMKCKQKTMKKMMSKKKKNRKITTRIEKHNETKQKKHEKCEKL